MLQNNRTEPSKKKKLSEKKKFVEKVAQITRVTKVCKGGKKMSFKAVVIVGNKINKVGVGIGKADDIINAISKAISNAKKKMIKVSLTNNYSIPHLTIGKYGASCALIKPAKLGTGVIAGSSIRTILELSGVKNILAKQLGTTNILNNARATILALKNLKTAKTVALLRNKIIEKI